MSLKLDGLHVVPATPDETWAKINDVEVLSRCIPGCESLEQHSPTEFSGVILFKIGPVKARFKGRVALTNLAPPNACRIVGEGEGGIAGFAKGAADVALTAIDEGTQLSYAIDASIGGKIAQLGSRLMAGTVKKLADEFFTKFVIECGDREFNQ